MRGSGLQKGAVALGVLGVAMVVTLHWMIFFWVPTEAAQGIVQRIFYLHVPSAWVGEMAFGLCALCSAVYLWLRDERLDMAAVALAEGGLVFLTITLIAGPLWARVAWGQYWQWEPRLTLTLLLWVLFFGYFMVRGSVGSEERGRRLGAVIAIIGAIDIPFIHLSVIWFRSLHPQPVVMKPEGPTLDSQMLATLMMGLAAFTVLFFAVFLLRYGLERARRESAVLLEAVR
ncbi:MAG: cytochrome c biogenesis protein [Gemmatimonadota bacterium]|nr:cytochrome c biogenesis protein CcsA [Gemmatimonadota bacterium]